MSVNLSKQTINWNFDRADRWNLIVSVQFHSYAIVKKIFPVDKIKNFSLNKIKSFEDNINLQFIKILYQIYWNNFYTK